MAMAAGVRYAPRQKEKDCMLKEFKRDYLYTDKEVFRKEFGGKTLKCAIKRDLTNKTYSVYAYVGPCITKNRLKKYQLIAVCRNDDKAFRFIDNETLRKMFSISERAELRELSGGKLLTFAQLKKEFTASLKEKTDSVFLKPLPGCVDDENIIKFEYMQDVYYHLLTPTRPVPCLDKLDFGFKLIFELSRSDEGYLIETCTGGWYQKIIQRWLGSVIDPSYPNFDIKNEISLYLSTIERMSANALADPKNPLRKYVAMKHAVEGHDIVTIDFRCHTNEGDKTMSLKVKASAFERGFIRQDIGTPDIDFKISYAGDISELDGIAGSLTSAIYEDDDEDEKGRWIGRDEILAIRDGDTVLWLADKN